MIWPEACSPAGRGESMVPVGLLFLTTIKRMGRVVAVRVKIVPKIIGQRYEAFVVDPRVREDDKGVDSMITISILANMK